MRLFSPKRSKLCKIILITRKRRQADWLLDPFFIDSKNSETSSHQTPPSSSESANHRFRDDFTGYARDQDAPTVTRYLTSPRPKRADRDTHSLPRERVRSPAHLALAARSGEGPLPIRFADLGHRARKTGGLLNSRPIFRADRTGSWLRMRHLAAHFSGWFVLA